MSASRASKTREEFTIGFYFVILIDPGFFLHIYVFEH